MRQNEVRTTEHNHTPSSKARQPGRHKKQPDTQREGPAKKLGQDATRDQPQGGGKQQQAGEGSRQQPSKGQTQRNPITHREAHNGKEKTPAKAQAETPAQQKHHKKEPSTRGSETQDQGQKTAGRARPKPRTRKINLTKTGARRGQDPTEARKKTPTTPPASGSKSQRGAQGQRAQETKSKSETTKSKGEEKKGEGRYVKLRVDIQGNVV